MTGGLASGISGAVSGIFGNIGYGRRLEKQVEAQKQLNEQAAQLNYEYGEKSAQNAYERMLNMYQRSYRDNSMAAMRGQAEQAGLSVGLLYGGGGVAGGGAGSTSGAGQASGIGMPSKTETEAGIQAQGMALQLANVASQTRLNESQADKNEADAEKTRGVDTKAQEATIDNLIAQTSNEKVKKGLILGQIRVADAEEELKRNMADWTKDKADETRWNIKSLQKGIDKLVEEINGMKLDNELKERTIDNKVKESSLTLQNLMSEILLKGSQRKVNEEQAKAIPAQILQGWEELTKKEKHSSSKKNKWKPMYKMYSTDTT